MRSLIPIILLVAACAGAQPAPATQDQLCELQALHGIVYDECIVIPPSLCGNGVIDVGDGEVCDGTNVGAETCVTQGFDSGVLACASDCLSFDTSSCVMPPPTSGGFTAQEAAEVEEQFNALYSINDSLLLVAHDWLKDNPSEASDVLRFVGDVVPELGQHIRAQLWLLDMNGHSSRSTGKTFLADNDRPTVLQKAFDTLDNVNYQPGINELVTMIASCSVSCSTLESAKAHLEAVEAIELDRTLPYTEPRLPWNLAFPVATREQSGWVSPHGDYRRFGENINASIVELVDAWEGYVETLIATGDITPGENGTINPFRKIEDLTKFTLNALSLSVGIEPSEYVADIDLQEQNDTTNRGRHFFRAVMALEILINTDHQAKDSEGDVFGRTDQVRGAPYSFGNSCSDIAKDFNNHTDPAVVAAMKTLGALCSWWSSTDNAAANILHLRYNTSFPVVPDP